MYVTFPTVAMERVSIVSEMDRLMNSMRFIDVQHMESSMEFMVVTQPAESLT